MNRRIRVATAIGAAAAVLVCGCFGSSNNGSAPDGGGLDAGGSETSVTVDGASDSTVGADATGSNDGGGDAAVIDATADGSSSGGGDARAEAAACGHSTCTGVEVKFIGWITGADGGIEPVEIAVDDATPDGGANGTIYLTTSATDPGIGNRNALVADFVTGSDGGVQYPPLYASDNNACSVPNFGGRTNAYYLVPMQGLPVSPSWQNVCGCGGNCGGACDDAGQGYLCDFENGFYSQSCPNFGFNCVITPERIEAIQVLPAQGSDATCKVCVYSSTSPSAATAIKCLSTGATLTKPQLVGGDGGAVFPALLRLDDGSSCASC